MKKIFSLIVAIMMIFVLAVGCTSLGKVKADDPKSISVLLAKVDKCKANKDGFQMLTIPPKNMIPEEGKVLAYLHVYRYNFRGEQGYGFGVYSEYGFIVLEYNIQNKTWMFSQNGMAQFMTDEDAAAAWCSWVNILEKDYDLDKSFCGWAPKIGPKQTV